MNDIPFMDKLNNQLLESERIFKFRSAVVSKGKYIDIEFLVNSYTYIDFLNDTLQKKVERLVKEILPSGLVVKIKYIKTLTTLDTVRQTLFEYIKVEKPTFYENFLMLDIEIEIMPTTVVINIPMEKFLADYAISANLGQELATILGNNFMEDFEINFIEIANSAVVLEDFEYEQKAYSLRYIDVQINSLIWGTIAHKPRYIIDVKDKDGKDISICGVMSNINKKYIEKIGKFIYSFKLYDTTAQINCKIFLDMKKKVHEKVANTLLDGNTFAMQGDIIYDKFDNGLVFMPDKIAFCTIDYKSIDTTPKYKTEKDTYTYIVPQKFVDEVQIDMLEQKTPKELVNKTFVVFDFETTGLNPSEDAITEIGAVKVHNGQIVETFATLINPEKDITEEITQITGITNEMVSNKHTIADIIGDFYKFTRGNNVVLVGHNVNFDLAFLNKYATINNYLFDNSVLDTIKLARERVQMKKYKLQYLCEKFQIPLNGAHRALNDAIATARLLIKLFSL